MRRSSAALLLLSVPACSTLRLLPARTTRCGAPALCAADPPASGPSPEEWRKFRQQLISGGLKLTTEATPDGEGAAPDATPSSAAAASSAPRLVVAPGNEAPRQRQRRQSREPSRNLSELPVGAAERAKRGAVARVHRGELGARVASGGAPPRECDRTGGKTGSTSQTLPRQFLDPSETAPGPSPAGGRHAAPDATRGAADAELALQRRRESPDAWL